MKKNIFKLNILLYSLLSLVIFTACEDDDVVPEEEEEMEVLSNSPWVRNHLQNL